MPRYSGNPDKPHILNNILISHATYMGFYSLEAKKQLLLKSFESAKWAKTLSLIEEKDCPLCMLAKADKEYKKEKEKENPENSTLVNLFEHEGLTRYYFADGIFCFYTYYVDNCRNTGITFRLRIDQKPERQLSKNGSYWWYPHPSTNAEIDHWLQTHPQYIHYTRKDIRK